MTQCDDAIPGGFARVVGKLGTKPVHVKPRSSIVRIFVCMSHEVTRRYLPPQTTNTINILCKYSFHELMKNLKLTQTAKF